jgi:hypothetical protein
MVSKSAKSSQAIIDCHQTSYGNLCRLTDPSIVGSKRRPARILPTYLLYSPGGELQGVHSGVLSCTALESIPSTTQPTGMNPRLWSQQVPRKGSLNLEFVLIYPAGTQQFHAAVTT